MDSFGLIPTETVIFTAVKNNGETDFGDANLTEQDFTVSNCIVQPVSAAELPVGFELLNKILINIHIPSVFTEELIGGYCTVRGIKFKILTATYPINSSPLSWNRHCLCEALL